MDRIDNALRDFTSALGPEISQTSAMAYNKRYSMISLNRALLSSTYTEEGIIQVLIEQPVDDAFRGGITITCEELDADDIKALQDEIENMEIIKTYSQALKWMRLFGGSGIIINCGQDLKKPFNIERINEKTPLTFHAVDRWELSYSPDGFGMIDQLYNPTTDHPYNYYGHVIEKSNVIKLMGKEAPSLLRGQFMGWGMSELEKVVRSFNQYLKHQNVTFELLDEAKVDVFSITGFNSAISTKHGAQKTAERIQMASQIKNYQNALVIDSEDKHEAKQIAFSGLAEILTQIRIGLACDLRMPMTKLFGISPSGLNASGEEEIENYNSMVETEIRTKVKSGMKMMLNVLCQKLFQHVPEKISFEFKPLREQSAQQMSMIKTESLNRILSAFGQGIMTSTTAVESINADHIFGVDISESEAMSLEDVMNITGEDVTGDVKTIGRTGKI